MTVCGRFVRDGLVSQDATLPSIAAFFCCKSGGFPQGYSACSAAYLLQPCMRLHSIGGGRWRRSSRQVKQRAGEGCTSLRMLRRCIGAEVEVDYKAHLHAYTPAALGLPCVRAAAAVAETSGCGALPAGTCIVIETTASTFLRASQRPRRSWAQLHFPQCPGSGLRRCCPLQLFNRLIDRGSRGCQPAKHAPALGPPRARPPLAAAALRPTSHASQAPNKTNQRRPAAPGAHSSPPEAERRQAAAAARSATMGLRDKMQQLTASLQQSQGAPQLQLPAAALPAAAAAPTLPPPAAVAVAPAQPPPQPVAPPVPAASQQPAILATGLARVSLVRQAQMAAASQAAAATQQAAAAAPISQVDASQGYNQDDYIWIGGRRIRKEGTSGRAALTLSQPPASQQTQQQQAQQQQADGIDRGAARAVVAVPAGKDAFDDNFELGPLPRAAGNGARGSGGSRPQPRAAPAPTSDSEEDALLGLLPRPSPKAASKQRGKRGGKAAAPGGSARKAAGDGASRAQARKGAAPKRKPQLARAQGEPGCRIWV